MAFPLLGLLPGILRALAKAVKLPILGEAADALSNTTLTPEQTAAAQEALQRHQEAMKALSVDELKAVVQAAMAENVAMVQSEDKFVKRARPFGLYAFYGITAAVALAQVFGQHIDAVAIMATLGPLGGAAGTYIYRRSSEKLGGNGTGE